VLLGPAGRRSYAWCYERQSGRGGTLPKRKAGNARGGSSGAPECAFTNDAGSGLLVPSGGPNVELGCEEDKSQRRAQTNGEQQGRAWSNKSSTAGPAFRTLVMRRAYSR